MIILHMFLFAFINGKAKDPRKLMETKSWFAMPWFSSLKLRVVDADNSGEISLDDPRSHRWRPVVSESTPKRRVKTRNLTTKL